MKWFKHETDAMDSEKMKALIHEFGFEGYGWFWRIMEIVAKKMDETNRCHYTQPVSEWCLNLKVKRKKLSLFLELIQFQTNIKAVYSEDKLRIEIPNLLKKRDNYTKDLQVADKKNGRNFPLDVDVDVDVNENANVNENLPPSPPNGGLYGGPQSAGSWANIPVVPTMTNMIHNNLKSANPPPGATVQYIGTDRLGNSPAEMPEIYWYNPEHAHGLHSIKGVKNN